MMGYAVLGTFNTLKETENELERVIKEDGLDPERLLVFKNKKGWSLEYD